MRRGETADPASLMSSRSRFDSCRRYCSSSGGVAQQRRALVCRARGRRFESGRPRFHGGRGVDGSTRGCDPRWRRFEPGRPPSLRADAEHRRAQQAVTLSPRAVVVRLHPSAPRGCSSTGRAPRLQRGRCRFDSDHLHLRLRSVNGKHAPFVRPRCGFDSSGGPFLRP